MQRAAYAYVLIPSMALCIILANAFFGHMLFGLSHDRLIAKYSIYVHLQQPGWNSSPGNILYDVTNVWSHRGDTANASYGDATEPDEASLLASAYNSNHVKYQDARPYVELKHEYSDCGVSWQPIPYRYAVDAVRGWIETMQGAQMLQSAHLDGAYEDAARADPYVWIFPNASGGADRGQSSAPNGYWQFVPACVSAGSNASTYDYAVSVNDPSLGFDVHFARPALDGEDDIYGFVPYEGPGCGAYNRSSFSGTCKDVERGSGLLIMLPDALEQSLTRVRIGLHERPVPELQ